MKVYLVGGAVRDQLLGLPVKEKDWVVVGATPEEMIAQGFKAVGKEFPVFLHPTTHEEYALARTERKTGKGYKGFTFYTASDITLEEDLKRRDLTINAIAQDEHGQLIDPYHGQQDLKHKILRHVSPAFQEDPVRILRLGRFAAKFADFNVDPGTQQLMRNMVDNGEVDALVAERVWRELARALENPKPSRFFQVLQDCRALHKLFPSITTQGITALNRASLPGPIRFATLVHDNNEKELTTLNKRYRVPKNYSELAVLTVKWGHHYAQLLTQKAADIVTFILRSDACRRPERFALFQTVCTSCYPNITAEHQAQVQKLIAAVNSINLNPLKEKGLKGEAFATARQALQQQAIEQVIEPNE